MEIKENKSRNTDRNSSKQKNKDNVGITIKI